MHPTSEVISICKNPHCRVKFHTVDPRKRYCTRKCQKAWNNHKARKKRLRQKTTNDAIQKNYRIMKEIIDKEELHGAFVSKDFLLGAGFDFDAFTSQLFYPPTLDFNRVYEYGIHPLPNDFFS